MERLDKLVSGRREISRREAKELIRRGLVLVNGVAAKSPEQQCSPGDVVLVKGQPLVMEEHVYLMLNKPAGVVSATRDGRCPTVLDLVPQPLRRKGLFPAGRLDKDTTGFVLLTDDGSFGHRIISPKTHLPKTYHAVLSKGGDWEALAAAFAQGMELGGGDKASPAELRLLRDGPRPLAELVIYEGVYHQVKRMFARFGLEVEELRRVRIGGVDLDPALQEGECRALTPAEQKLLCAK